MSYPLNNVATVDGYVTVNTLDNIPTVARVNIEVLNAGIYYQLRASEAGPRIQAADWNPEVRLNPSRNSLDRVTTGIRVRSAVAGTPAIVNIEMLTKSELGIA